MSVNRREFLERATACAAGGAVALAANDGAASALDREAKPRLPEALGLLYDSTLCVGCKACVAGCKAANGMPPEISADQSEWNSGTWDSPKDLSGKTLNIIKVYRDGTMEQKDSGTDGFAFIKRQCLHCVDPSCPAARFRR
jgi:Fe-S-cluster-containing dehydrogenase component